MKKYISFVLILTMLFGIVPTLSGCNNDNASGKLSVITTIFPEYDWVLQIMGEKASDAEVTLLLDNGVDLHNYQPTAADIIKISECDLFICVGGESDGWVEDILASTANKDLNVVRLLDVLGDDIVKEEEHVPGMEHDEEPSHDDEHESDEHVWLSLKNAKLLCSHIAERLCAADPENKEIYQRNLTEYLAKLGALDAEYRAEVEAASKKTLLFGDRFPFRYLVEDYDLEYYAAFSGCSSESEASFETIAFLAERMDTLGLEVILTIDDGNAKIAETIVSNTAARNARVLSMNSMQACTPADIAKGVSYLSVMEANLAVLRDALK